MHWLLVRLLRTAADAIPAQHVREVLDRQFAPQALAAEARFMAQPDEGVPAAHVRVGLGAGRQFRPDCCDSIFCSIQ